ncbi:MAG: PAS domain S-box protein [Acidobacteria bacterium]|nr:PAS domain S-box protein [Acidobacteriota bacterium]
MKDRLFRLGSVVRRALGEARDRQGRLEVEVALREEEEKTRLILDGALDAVVTMGVDGRVTGWNPQAERTFGWSREEALGRLMSDLIIPPALRAAHRAGLARFAATGVGPILSKRIELNALHKEGEEFPVELTVIPIHSNVGTSFAAFIRDIGPVKRAFSRLAVEHAVTRVLAESPGLDRAIPKLLRAIAEGLSWSVAQFWSVDARSETLRAAHSWPLPADHKFIESNREFVFGKGVGLLGRVWAERKPLWTPDVAREGNFLRGALAEQESLRGLIAFPILLGTEVFGVFEFLSKEIRQPDAEMLAMINAVGSQISQFIERKRAEEEIGLLYRDLEQRVAQRTAELEESVRETASFMHTIAHDLRAPLRSIAGFCQAMVEDFGDSISPVCLNYAQRVEGSARRMDLLIQNLLDYGRFIHLKLELTPVDVDQVVREVLERMAPEITQREAEVLVEGELFSVQAHAGALFEVLACMISNAIKFVARDVRPRVTIRAELKDGWIRLWVEDDGIGIAPQYHDRIFGVFERLNRQEEFPGTGIGLALARKASDRMGGRTGVESELGKGSRFWIELPKAEPTGQPP